MSPDPSLQGTMTRCLSNPVIITTISFFQGGPAKLKRATGYYAATAWMSMEAEGLAKQLGRLH